MKEQTERILRLSLILRIYPWTSFHVSKNWAEASRRIVSALFSTLILFQTLACADEKTVDNRFKTISVQQARQPVQQMVSESLTVVSLNLAHGRRTSRSQIFVTTNQTKKNLESIALFLKDIDADIVALQEADEPSWWSGNFHHVAYLAQHGRYPQYIHESHAHIGIGHYGTGILSRLPIREGHAQTFTPSWPTARKGFTLAEIEWQTTQRTVIVDVVSVHMDFSRSSIRKRQLQEMQATLSRRGHPLIIMGDFNSEWIADQLIQGSMAESASLHTFFDRERDLGTYKGKRLDWILVSKTFVIETYDVSSRTLSDHLAVVARIRLSSERTDLN